MSPAYLFCLIIAIAAIALWWYYRSEAPARKPARKGATVSTEARPIAPAPAPTVEPEDAPSAPEPQHDLRAFFLPEEAGIYHRVERLSETRWEDLAHSLVELSRLPTDVAELLEALNNPKTSASDVAGVCERNVGITARVLKLVNSPFYGTASPVEDVRHAVALLGFDEIRQLVLTSSLFSHARKFEGPISIDSLWEHSLATARLTSWLAAHLHVECRKELAGTAATLHDVGKVVLQSWRPEALRRTLTMAREQGKSLLAAELDELGVTHALAGALLLDRWHLPATLISVVKGCHLPVLSIELPEAALVHLAGQVARLLEIGADGEPAEVVPDDLREFLGIDADTVSALLDRGFEEFISSALADVHVGAIA